jgi:hypothetical protein
MEVQRTGNPCGDNAVWLQCQPHKEAYLKAISKKRESSWAGKNMNVLNNNFFLLIEGQPSLSPT